MTKANTVANPMEVVAGVSLSMIKDPAIMIPRDRVMEEGGQEQECTMMVAEVCPGLLSLLSTKFIICAFFNLSLKYILDNKMIQATKCQGIG